MDVALLGCAMAVSTVTFLIGLVGQDLGDCRVAASEPFVLGERVGVSGSS